MLGKVIGALLGFFLLRNVFGVFIGAFVGHLWDTGTLRVRAAAAPNPSAFQAPLFGLAGAIAKSDGRVSEQEIAAVENLMVRMQLSGAQRAEAIARFTAGKQDTFPVHLAIADLKTWCHGRRDLAFLLLDLLLDIVYAEGPLVGPKFAIVRKLCWALSVQERELAALAAMRGYRYAAAGAAGGDQRSAPPPPQTSLAKDPYAVLGLDARAGNSEIKRAYRKQISRHHPDKLGDVPEELKRRAEERAREINAAYEKIRSERNIT